MINISFDLKFTIGLILEEILDAHANLNKKISWERSYVKQRPEEAFVIIYLERVLTHINDDASSSTLGVLLSIYELYPLNLSFMIDSKLNGSTSSIFSESSE